MIRVLRADIDEAIKFLSQEHAEIFKKYLETVSRARRNPPNNDVTDDQRRETMNNHPELFAVQRAIWTKYQAKGAIYIAELITEITNISLAANKDLKND